MFYGVESLGSRRTWGVVYALVALAGLSLLVPPFSPTNFMQSGLGPFLYICGSLIAVCFGTAAGASLYHGRRLYWLENVASWFGIAGLSVFFFALLQGALLSEKFSDLPEALTILALLVVLTGRAWLLQRYLRKERKVLDVVRIAIRNDT